MVFFCNTICERIGESSEGLKIHTVETLVVFKTTQTRTRVTQVQFDVSFAKCLLRFYGMPSALLEAVRVHSCEDSISLWGRTAVGKRMAWSMLISYPLEHVAYLKWTSPELISSSLNVNRFSAYSWSILTRVLGC
jgi:glutamate formiminotransferase